jgi:hypothetical protein
MDVLTVLMERLVELFPAELEPVSVQLCAQLCESFNRIVADTQASGTSWEENGDWDESGDKIMAAMGLVKTINTLVLSVAPEVPAPDGSNLLLVQKLEETLLPSVAFILQNEVIGKMS